MGRNSQAYIQVDASFKGYHDGWGQMAALLLYTEQSPLYNAINITLGPYQLRNNTFPGVGITTLWCPSDAQIQGLRYFEQSAGWDGTTIGICYTSYRGVCGTFMNNSGTPAIEQQILPALTGMFPDIGGPTWYNGLPSQPPVRIAAVTDGTSNTMLFGESAQGKLSQVGCDAYGDCPFEGQGWWADADWGDSTMSTFYPPNLKGADVTILPGNCDPASIAGESATSFHPGGCNFAFADGSVKFIKDSINSWNWAAVQPLQNATTCIPTLPLGITNGVYQALSTRNGGEVISSDQY